MTTATLSLRPGDARDIAAVDALMTRSFDPEWGEAWTRGQCLGVLGMPGIRLTLAYLDDRPAGFALVRRILDEAELLLLAVAPACRRGGVGAALVRAVIDRAAADGAGTLHLEVRAGNEAIRLYAAHGFEPVGRRPRYYRGRTGQLHDALTYRRPLP